MPFLLPRSEMPEQTIGPFKIRRCFEGCSNAVIDTARAEKVLSNVLHEGDYVCKFGAEISGAKPMPHQLFHIAIAGCPNSCTQPQVKDFGVQGQAVPHIGTDCILCGGCVTACPEGLVKLTQDAPIIDTAECLNCERCVRACPSETLTTLRKGYRVLVGGKLGRRPRLGQVLYPLIDDKGLADSFKASLDFYLQERRPRERFGGLVERTGVTVLREM